MIHNQTLQDKTTFFEMIRNDFELYTTLQFPNAVILNAVGRKCVQKSANGRKRAQMGAKEALRRKNCRQPGLKQPGSHQHATSPPLAFTVHLCMCIASLPLSLSLSLWHANLLLLFVVL